MNAVVPTSALIPTNMDQAMRLAEMMSRGRLMPEHLRNPADALMVVELAMRLGMSPFAVAQATSVIQGKLMLEGKLVGAALNASGILSSRLDYRHTGEGASRAVTVSGVLKGETTAREVTVTLQEAKTSNGMWTKQPDQQLVYAATRVWARRHAPEVMLGVYAPEEFDHDMPAREPPHTGPTIDAQPETDRERVNREVPMDKPPTTTTVKLPDWKTFLASLEIAMRDCRSMVEVDRVIARPDTQHAMASYKGPAKARLDGIIAHGIGRFAQVENAPENAPVQEPPDDDFGGWPGPDPAEMRRQREAAEA